MGRFSIEFDLANHKDVVLAEAGVLPEDKVRRAQVKGLVDTGATDLVLPASLVAALGLVEIGRVAVRYADSRRAVRSEVGDVEVKILGRSKVFSAVVEPSRTEALVGAMVLEALDLIVNPMDQKLEPRDPQGMTASLGW